ncbi:cation:proton antiporter [Pyrobaculum neutrophilum]|uniref:Sodium/hydrogen exchanger n=1 Tax=Pyrobaculum neutrophilum (strain DSM 2338 / JCM 9278 / NBRC 100436 / V24Sta) TaxID=444157 RepID=B1Y9G5_PYRNV|nr:cation:proton antiporter [Pyrobaculum neutrophilum]ACB40394.1 sodium/hydrogen exchanger [Pyrobaculum neutrophilum V24Sta]
MLLGEISIAVFIGVLFAYFLDRVGFPSFLGFFLAGALVGKLAGVALPEIYIQLLLSLVAFEVGRQLGAGGFSPAAFFAVIIEASLIVSFTTLIYKLAGLTLGDALVASVVMLSSSSLLTTKLVSGLPSEARSVALSLTSLEDAVLFFTLSLLLGGTNLGNLPISLVMLVALAAVALALFKFFYRYIVGRDYALPFALATAFALVYIVQSLHIASPFLGAFIGGYLFSKADVHGVHTREAAALSNLIIYIYMLALGVSIPAAAVDPLLLALSISAALLAVFIRAAAVFTSSWLVTGKPSLSVDVSLATAHISEISITIPILAYQLGVIKNAELALALAIAPVITLFLAPWAWGRRGALERFVSRRVGELKTAVAYEKLYRVLTHAFLAVAKLAILSVATALAIAYLWPASPVLLVLTLPFMVKYSRAMYRDLLIALREVGKARAASIVVVTSVFALSMYVAFALVVKIAEVHLYTSLLVAAVLLYNLFAVLRATRRSDNPV